MIITCLKDRNKQGDRTFTPGGFTEVPIEFGLSKWRRIVVLFWNTFFAFSISQWKKYDVMGTSERQRYKSYCLDYSAVLSWTKYLNFHGSESRIWIVTQTVKGTNGGFPCLYCFDIARDCLCGDLPSFGIGDNANHFRSKRLRFLRIMQFACFDWPLFSGICYQFSLVYLHFMKFYRLEL